MRSRIITLVLIFLASNTNIFSQYKNEYSNEVKDFMNLVENYWQKLDNMPNVSDFYLTQKETGDILEKLYKAIEDDPDGYVNYIVRRNREQANDFKKNIVDASKPTIGNIIGLIQLKIAEIYSKQYVALITTPYFLRIKIMNKSASEYKDLEGRTHDQTNINGDIEEIVKGENKFMKGENVSFMYLNSKNCCRTFEIGKTYFVPLTVSTLENSNYEGLTTQWFDCNHTYVIENETIRIPGDYFQVGEEINWQIFKERFTKKYLINNK
jgi:hypothetical protein